MSLANMSLCIRKTGKCFHVNCRERKC